MFDQPHLSIMTHARAGLAFSIFHGQPLRARILPLMHWVFLAWIALISPAWAEQSLTEAWAEYRLEDAKVDVVIRKSGNTAEAQQMRARILPRYRELSRQLNALPLEERRAVEQAADKIFQAKVVRISGNPYAVEAQRRQGAQDAAANVAKYEAAVAREQQSRDSAWGTLFKAIGLLIVALIAWWWLRARKKKKAEKKAELAKRLKFTQWKAEHLEKFGATAAERAARIQQLFAGNQGTVSYATWWDPPPEAGLGVAYVAFSINRNLAAMEPPAPPDAACRRAAQQRRGWPTALVGVGALWSHLG